MRQLFSTTVQRGGRCPSCISLLPLVSIGDPSHDQPCSSRTATRSRIPSPPCVFLPSNGTDCCHNISRHVRGHIGRWDEICTLKRAIVLSPNWKQHNTCPTRPAACRNESASAREMHTPYASVPLPRLLQMPRPLDATDITRQAGRMHVYHPGWWEVCSAARPHDIPHSSKRTKQKKEMNRSHDGWNHGCYCEAPTSAGFPAKEKKGFSVTQMSEACSQPRNTAHTGYIQETNNIHVSIFQDWAFA